MSESLNPLLFQLSSGGVSEEELLELFGVALTEKFDEENPVKSVNLFSPSSGLIWVKGIAVAQRLVDLMEIDLNENLAAQIDFPKNHATSLVEIQPSPGIKRRPSPWSKIDIDGLEKAVKNVSTSENPVTFSVSNKQRVVVKFRDASDVVAKSNMIVEALNEDKSAGVSSRPVLVKENVIMRACYHGPQRFCELEKQILETTGQTVKDLVIGRFSHYKDKPVILSVQCPSSYSVDTRGKDKKNKNRETENEKNAYDFAQVLDSDSPAPEEEEEDIENEDVIAGESTRADKVTKGVIGKENSECEEEEEEEEGDNRADPSGLLSTTSETILSISPSAATSESPQQKAALTEVVSEVAGRIKEAEAEVEADVEADVEAEAPANDSTPTEPMPPDDGAVVAPL
mmetsp:Transcript_29282/g.49303  ORF Transcript_29282/g.49303 Transcript_29282/m.49303 type:complete len:400 (+) Transcript_29282:100-1299(+)